MFIYEPTNPEVILIHLHGFASNVRGSKIEVLKERSLRGRFSFFAMDMDYQTTTTSRVLEVLDALVKGFSQKFSTLWLSGSSHGGYVSLNYLKFYKPERVSKVFLFAPSYSTLGLTLREVGEDRCKRWLEGREELSFTECETGLEITIHKDFAVDILQRGYEIIRDGEVNFPSELPYELYVFHGTQDNMVPIEHSRLFASKVKVKEFLELEDDHRLSKTFKGLVEKYL
ncbi:YqiA/YcfP family alpha/beta fold hydrolase [Pampinifervens florentissimum]|uniref:YqiA/YcfP family alpha/beta fold hydrolase n=1 Tax=Pampinifervens florentissimum TaxID=1632019 RepID=UPI0013B4968E|nr:YqiA/YcfP family alpha/beta fold hydrolase [Hydrogenobacter sp. T-8]QID34038.1 alpha/beta hydrolase [Hydrogenobacter sp. T-8]